jgi:hypothetical protein
LLPDRTDASGWLSFSQDFGPSDQKVELVEIADAVPPGVVSVSPAAGSTGAAVDGGVTVKFTEPVLSSSVESNFTLAAAQPVPGTFEWSEAGDSVTFHPSSPLAEGTTYELTIAGVEDLVSNQNSTAFRSWFVTYSQEPLLTVSGTVTDAGGTPVQGAKVTIDGTTHTTDADGDFLFSPVAAGSHEVTITANGYGPATLEAEAGSIVNATLTQQPPGVPSTAGALPPVAIGADIAVIALLCVGVLFVAFGSKPPSATRMVKGFLRRLRRR